MFNNHGQPVQRREVFGIANGIRYEAFCSFGNEPWNFNTCGHNGFPINTRNERLVLQGQMPHQDGQYYGTCGNVAYCRNCMNPFGSCGCQGYGAVNQWGGSLQLVGELELMQGIMTGNVAEMVAGEALLSCGNCYGFCGCGRGGMIAGSMGYGAPMAMALACGNCYGSCSCGSMAEVVGEAMVFDGIVNGDLGEVLEGEFLEGFGDDGGFF